MTVLRPQDYLKKLVELRTRPIRDLAEYAETLWFDHIPAEPERRAVTGAPPADPLAWISLDRPRQALLPPVPRCWPPGRVCRSCRTRRRIHGFARRPTL